MLDIHPEWKLLQLNNIIMLVPSEYVDILLKNYFQNKKVDPIVESILQGGNVIYDLSIGQLGNVSNKDVNIY